MRKEVLDSTFIKFLASIFLISTFFLGSCQKSDSIDSLREKIRNDPDFLSYHKALKDNVELIATKRFYEDSAAHLYIKNHTAATKNLNDLKKIYAEAGVNNADIYLDNLDKARQSLFKLINKYSELKQMKREEGTNFLKSIRPALNLDPGYILEQRKQNSKN